MITPAIFPSVLLAQQAPIVGDPFREAVPPASDAELTALVERQGMICEEIDQQARRAQSLAYDAVLLQAELERNERDNPPANDAMGRVMAQISAAMKARTLLDQANFDSLGQTLERASAQFCAAANRP